MEQKHLLEELIEARDGQKSLLKEGLLEKLKEAGESAKEKRRNQRGKAISAVANGL